MAELITIADARRQVLELVQPLPGEQIPVTDGLERVLAATVTAGTDVPPFPASAMDGYAVEAGPAGRRLVVVGESRAGTPSQRALQPGEAIRISTGAAVPAGATAVIPQEEVERGEGVITLSAQVHPGAHIRPAGEVMRAGGPVLTPGTRIGAAELAAAITAGAGSLTVARRPVAAVLSTGDELREPGAVLGAGEIHNSNGHMLRAMAGHCGALAGPPGRLPDDRAATEAGLERALDQAEVVIVSGGVSVGPHDHVKPALAALGVSERWWGVSLQPGKPTWFGTRERRLVFGLPGNPVSAAVTFSLFVAPALAALQGAAPQPAPGRAVLGAPVARNPRREQAVRVRLEQRGETLVALPNGPQGSHVVTSLVGADALALIAAGEGAVAEGDTVPLAPLVR
jgi:molybdopterin molybdotransferase